MKKSLLHLLQTGADHELSAQELESYSDVNLLIAYTHKNMKKMLSINYAHISFELINRNIHPYIKNHDNK